MSLSDRCHSARGDRFLEEYTDVAENGINPLEHYIQSGSDEGRFANAVFQSFELGEALAVSSEIEGEEFALFKDTSFAVIETKEKID